MTTWIAVFAPVFLLALGACALMWRFSPHRDNPDLRFAGTIAKVMGLFQEPTIVTSYVFCNVFTYMRFCRFWMLVVPLWAQGLVGRAWAAGVIKGDEAGRLNLTVQDLKDLQRLDNLGLIKGVG